MRRVDNLIFLAILVILAGCETNPSTGRSQLILVSGDQTLQMGIEAKPQLIEEYGGEYPSEPLQAYIDRVGRNLLNHIEPVYADQPWEFFLLDSEVINAFALPGGKVFMTVGLLVHFSNEAQVAGVLGHEIGHVTALHVDERLSQTLAAQLGLGIFGIASDSDLVTAGVAVLVGGTLLKFSRDQELEADRQGLKYMSRAHYNPIGLRQVLEVLRDEASGGKSLEFLATHPHPERRLSQVDALLVEGYAYTQGNPDYGIFEQRFDRDAVPYLPSKSVRLDQAVSPLQFCSLCRSVETGF